MSFKTQIHCATTVMSRCQVYSNKKTHAGRHAGTTEAYHLRLDVNHVLHLGRWKTGQMQAFYAPMIPITGAFYMAHFNKIDEPYFIERDLVTPPLALQRLIFPWIEDNFKTDMPQKTQSWIKECDQEMEGLDPNVCTAEDLHSIPPRESAATVGTSRIYDTVLVNRIAFLKLLVRMRRVILQDAVLYMRTDEAGRSLTNNLLASLDVFKNPMFIKFQADLIRAMDEYSKRPDLIEPHVLVNRDTVVQGFNSLNSGLNSLNSGLNSLNSGLNSLNSGLNSLIGRISRIEQQQDKVIRGISAQINRMMQQQEELSKERQAQSQLSAMNDTFNLELHQLMARSPQVFLQNQQSSSQSPQWPRPRPQSSPQPSVLSQSAEQQSEVPQGDDRSKGYIMLPDTCLTVQQAWDEFYGPVKVAILQDKAWPFTPARRKAYRRRHQLIELIRREAKRRDQRIDEFVKALSEASKGRTMNSLRLEMEAKEKGVTKEGDQEENTQAQSS
ncbi:hypothetical protein BCR41DRAFT_215009 [Lobosporangium transversale]|uniref:Ndc10 domain-containing protein n=1 Tax=Lobosporangium transversale TaxID=64571 RepID=A0A1Y2G791_9FUNG|nr:hypothetical protein BCR41DRAFT_215009 [Lobosporangium transversale]ORY99697.1 hypothetical protein BCR41DRAFT_215009 [Lobosporangium transversale]|eukprot:XP_021875961.1 hypothetical protein BCR41DRAFT_215009 [Lobosporangium transversale]